MSFSASAVPRGYADGAAVPDAAVQGENSRVAEPGVVSGSVATMVVVASAVAAVVAQAVEPEPVPDVARKSPPDVVNHVEGPGCFRPPCFCGPSPLPGGAARSATPLRVAAWDCCCWDPLTIVVLQWEVGIKWSECPVATGHNPLPQQFLYFLPEPQGHGSLRPTFGAALTGVGRRLAAAPAPAAAARWAFSPGRPSLEALYWE